MSKITLAVPAANGQGASAVWPGGWATVSCRGTFDSGTVTLQVSFDSGTTWETAVDEAGDSIAFAATGHKQMSYAGDTTCYVRASVGGSSGATDVDLDLLCGYAGVKRPGLDA